MLMKLRIIVLITIGLSRYGSSLTKLPRISEEGSVSLSLLNNKTREQEGREKSFGIFNPFEKKNNLETNVETLLTQVAKLNADVSTLNSKVEQLMQSQGQADANMQPIPSILNSRTSITGSSSSNRNDVTALNKRVTALNKHVTALNKHVTALNKRVTASNKRVTASNKHVTALNKHVTALNKHMTTHLKALATLNESASSNRKVIASLNKQMEQLKQFQKRADESIRAFTVNGVNMTTHLKALASVNGSLSSNHKEIEELKQFQEQAGESFQSMATQFKALAVVNESSSCNCKEVEQLLQFQKRADASIKDMTMQFKALATVNGNSSSYREACPIAAYQIGGKMIGEFCYIVSAVSLNFSQAQNACNVLAGNLAQPLPIMALNSRLYTSLKGFFPTKFERIKNIGGNESGLWIGYKQETSDANKGVFTGQMSGLITVEKDSVIIDGIVETEAQEGMAITEAGFWKIHPLSKSLPYICQFPHILMHPHIYSSK